MKPDFNISDVKNVKVYICLFRLEPLKYTGEGRKK